MSLNTSRWINAVLIVGMFVAVASLYADKAVKKTKKDANPWALGELFKRSGCLKVPLNEVRLADKYGRKWDFTKKDRGNFTYFEGVKDVGATKDGALTFTLEDKVATIGWGNYGGKQAEKERVSLWPRFNLTFKARQSMDKPTAFKLAFWHKGKRLEYDANGRVRFCSSDTVTLKGTDWMELTYRMWPGLPLRDGFDFEIRGPKGDKIEIKDLRITRYENKGFFRKEITLPDSEVWSALAEVGAMTHLYINGHEVGADVKPEGAVAELYGNKTVDLKKYFKPGKVNCVAFSGQRYGETDGALPYICLQGSVITASGKRILLDSDDSYTWSMEAEDGWNKIGFDDSKWKKITNNRKDSKAVTVNPNWCLNYKGKRNRPVHDGYIRLANPHDEQLYYKDSQDVNFHIYVPNGLEKKDLALDWIVSEYKDGTFKEIKRGSAKDYKYLGKSLRLTVNAGRLPRGVYTLKTVLKDGENILDDRIPEPLVVTGRLPMRWTDGKAYDQDMDLELEREIDFNDPSDGPWLEGAGGPRAPKPSKDPNAGIKEANVVENNGLKYRETTPNYGAVISYLMEFKHPGDFYLMELDYPNDKARALGVACCPRNWGLCAKNSYSKTSAAVVTGGRYPITGKMQTLRWVYRPDPGKHSINLVNLNRDLIPAGASKLRIKHIKNGLPALKASKENTRWNGLMTERTKDEPARFGIKKKPIPEGAAVYKERMGKPYIEPVKVICSKLEHDLDACEAFVRYMRFAGQNVHVMGSFQYHGGNPPGYLPAWSFPCARLKGGIRDVLARVLRDNDIDFFAHIEFVHCPGLMRLAAEKPDRPAKGFWDTPYLVTPNGEEYTGWGGRYGFNFNHPKVRKEMVAVGMDIAKKFKSLSNFKGIVWNPYFGGDWIPTYRGRLRRGALEAHELTHYGYGDVSIREFEKDTGWKVPFSMDDPERFKKRHAYLNSEEMKDKWLSWRAEKMKSFFRDVADGIHTHRQDLTCICNCYMNPIHFLEWRRSGLSFGDYMKANGWDGTLFAEDEAVSLAPTLYGKLNHHNRRVGEHGLGWDMTGAPEVREAFKAEKNRAVQIKHDWLEVEEMAWHLPPRKDWPRHFQMTLMPQPDGNNSRECFIRALIELDPDLFYYGFADATLFEGNEQTLREFNRVLRSLPTEKFKPVDNTGLNSNLAIRTLKRDFDTWFYVANPGYWPISGKIVFENAEKVVDSVTDKELAKAGWGGKTTVDVTLAPFGVAAFKVPANNAKVTSWKANAEEGIGTRHLEKIVKETEELLRNPAALVVLRPEDETFMRKTVDAARKAMDKGDYAAALLYTSSDRFWILKTEYMEKGAEYATETKRNDQVDTKRKTAQSRKVAKAPTIDGKFDDPVWREAETYGGFIAADKMPAMAASSFKVLNDADNIYLAVECKDRKPSEIKMNAKNEKKVFKDDCVALFIQPDPNESTYYQMAFSANGTKFDQKIKGGSKDYAFAPPWDVKTKVTDDGWVAEIKLPASSLGGKLTKDQPWRFNVHRAFRDQKAPHTSWSYTPASWHDLERLGEIKFE